MRHTNMRRKKKHLWIFVGLLLFAACSNKRIDHLPILGTSTLPTASFSINNDEAVELRTERGTVINLPDNAFVDSLGNPITENIRIEVKEVFTALDMVLGGMTTTYNGQYLESGGMIYLEATTNGQTLKLAEDKELSIAVLTDSTLRGMQVFEGIVTENGIDWQNPVAISEMVEEEVARLEEKPFQSNASWKIHHKTDEDQVPQEIIDTACGITDANCGLVLKNDCTIYIDGYRIDFNKLDSFRSQPWGTGDISRKEGTVGMNSFKEDQSSSYIFSIKKLGWANIDRLFSDPRTKEIELITKVNDYNSYDGIYISMVFENQNMYLPGYQCKDKTFSFTHGDFEKPKLPLGETATIIVTAYKDEIPHYGLQTFQIAEKQTIELKLTPTTSEELKDALMNSI